MAYAFAIQAVLMLIASANGFLMGATNVLSPWLAFPLSTIALVVAYLSGVMAIRALKD